MIKKIVCYLDVTDVEVAHDIATDIQSDLQVANGVIRSWVGVIDAEQTETSEIPWIESQSW
jgi:hypothetical protein